MTISDLKSRVREWGKVSGGPAIDLEPSYGSGLTARLSEALRELSRVSAAFYGIRKFTIPAAASEVSLESAGFAYVAHVTGGSGVLRNYAGDPGPISWEEYGALLRADLPTANPTRWCRGPQSILFDSKPSGNLLWPGNGFLLHSVVDDDADTVEFLEGDSDGVAAWCVAHLAGPVATGAGLEHYSRAQAEGLAVAQRLAGTAFESYGYQAPALAMQEMPVGREVVNDGG